MINLKTINLRKPLSIFGLGLAVFAVGSAAQPASAAGLTVSHTAQINQAVVADHFEIVYGNGGDYDHRRDGDRDRWQAARQGGRDWHEDHRDWREDRRDQREDFRDAQRDWHQDQRGQDRWQAWHQDQRDGSHDGGDWNRDR